MIHNVWAKNSSYRNEFSLFFSKTELDYLITNSTTDKATSEWIVTTYSQRNWVEVFYRDAFVMVRIKRIPSKRAGEPLSTLHLGVLCLQFYSLTAVKWWTETTMC
jgi:hypothetical protein